MQFQTKCVCFIYVGINKSEEHNYYSANNYSRNNTGASEVLPLEPPIKGALFELCYQTWQAER